MKRDDGRMDRWPIYDDEQISDVVEVLRSGRVNAWTGSYVGDFESAYASSIGRKHAIALANGSVALDVAVRVLGIGEGDEVIVTPRSFAISASCVPMAGGVPVFADVDRDSQNISASAIREKMTERTRGIIVVHLAGWPCDMTAIEALAREHGVWLVEDCAQAHGAEVDGRPVGSFGDISVFSFCQDKIITTGGEGGLLAMDDDKLWNDAWSWKDHGKSYEAVFQRQHPPGFRWLHEGWGTNLRMTSLQAALGLRQLERLPTWHEQRTRNANFLIDEFDKLPLLRTPRPPSNVRHAWYRLYTFIRPEWLKPGWSRDRILREIDAAGVECFTGSCPEIYLERAFADRGFSPEERLPNARLLGETSLAFLVDPAQSADKLRRTTGAVRDVVVAASIG